MPYPVIDVQGARLVRDRLEQARLDGAGLVELAGESLIGIADVQRQRGSADYHAEQVQSVAHQAFDAYLNRPGGGGAVASASELYQLEAEMAGPVHACLHDHDVEVLADPDFWRFLHLGPFRWYLLVREPEMKPHDFGGTEAGRKFWLMVRTYLWGGFAFDPDDDANHYRRCTAVGDAGVRENGRPGKVIDFWHSHLIRRNVAPCNAVSRAFIDAATTTPVALDDDAREFAKHMLRVGRSTSLQLLDDHEVASVVAEQKKRALRDATP